MSKSESDLESGKGVDRIAAFSDAIFAFDDLACNWNRHPKRLSSDDGGRAGKNLGWIDSRHSRLFLELINSAGFGG